MKQFLLSLALSFFTLASFASNKICVGEKIIVVLNEHVKTLTVHDRVSMEIIQMNGLEGDYFGDLALSSDGSNIWFQIDDKMYCRSIESGEILKELPGGDSFSFEMSAAMDYLIHYQTIDSKSLVYVYDLNTTEAVSYAKLNSKLELETAHYDPKKQLLHVLSQTYPSKNETSNKDSDLGVPQSIEQIELEFRHDQEEMHYMVYDIQNKHALYEEWIAYSPNGACNFEQINDALYLVSGLGTAKVRDDFTFELTSIVCLNQVDFDVHQSEIVGINGTLMYNYSTEKNSLTIYDESDVNRILLEASGIAMTDTEFYCIKEGILYRLLRATPMSIDYEVALDQ